MVKGGVGGGFRRAGPVLYALLAVALGVVSAAAVVTWVAPAFYELPTHHCPFCLLSARAGYAGYLLYPALFAAVVAGAGGGLVHLLRRLDPEGELRPGEERRLCKVSMVAFALFALIAVWPLLAAGLRMEG